MVGVRGLLQSIFGAAEAGTGDSLAGDDDRGAEETLLAAAAQEEDEPPYVPSRFDGEYNVWFRRRPLGVGLVPSTQLYGAWEVSSIQRPARPRRGSMVDEEEEEEKEEEDGRALISLGDVVVALNFSGRSARLPRRPFLELLRRSAFPIAMTLRKPEIYGSFASRALSTAMYPDSADYEGQRSEDKKFTARVSSKQWKRTLKHDLAANARKAKHDHARHFVEQLLLSDDEFPSTAASSTGPNAHAAGIAAALSQFPRRAMAQHGAGQDHTAVLLSPMGEYECTFNEKPIHLVLAPSTRLYGSVEVYDPKVHSPAIQVGDVIIAVNGDTTVAKMQSDDLIDYIVELSPPVVLCLRRPMAYRKYLKEFFRSDRHEVSSQSTAHAMFPNSAEYRKPASSHGSSPQKQPLTLKAASESQLGPTIKTTLSRSNSIARVPVLSPAARNRLDELKEFAAHMNAKDQFKLWASHGPETVPEQRSSILTERHVQFLWSHLPMYLTCNEMELVYDTRCHGWNLLSFFARLDGKGPTVVVVKDTRDNIFGAFCSASWKRSMDVYGNGRSFVFSLRPQMRVHAWSGVESSFMYFRQDALFVGGGKTGIALCLQLDEMRGFTQPCETFASPRLAEHESFRCESIEVWCFSGFKI
jgi:hypothetical protein